MGATTIPTQAVTERIVRGTDIFEVDTLVSGKLRLARKVGK